MHGEDIFITRHGKTVAKIVPAGTTPNSESVKAAGLRLRNLAKEMKLGPFVWDEWNSYRDIGRC